MMNAVFLSTVCPCPHFPHIAPTLEEWQGLVGNWKFISLISPHTPHYWNLLLSSVWTKRGSGEKTLIFEQGRWSENTDALITSGEIFGGNQEILWRWARYGHILDKLWGGGGADVDFLPTNSPLFVCTAHCKERQNGFYMGVAGWQC